MSVRLRMLQSRHWVRAQASADGRRRTGGGGKSTTSIDVQIVEIKDLIVEAPGFAPGSENTSSQESTMRIRV